MGGQSEPRLERYAMAVVFGLIGAIALLVVWMSLYTVPVGWSVLVARLVIYGLTPLGIGLLFGLVGLYREPLGSGESVVTGAVTLFIPTVWALPLLNPDTMLATAVALCLISSGSYLLPLVHRRVVAKQDGILRMELRTVIVPSVTILLVLAVVVSASAAGAVIPRGNECGAGHSVQSIPAPKLGDTTPDTIQVRWEFEYANESVLITHAGGDNVPMERLTIAVGQSSVAWARLTSDTDGEVTAGDTARFAHVSRGETVRIRWRPEDADCERTLVEHEL